MNDDQSQGGALPKRTYKYISEFKHTECKDERERMVYKAIEDVKAFHGLYPGVGDRFPLIDLSWVMVTKRSIIQAGIMAIPDGKSAYSDIHYPSGLYLTLEDIDSPDPDVNSSNSHMPWALKRDDDSEFYLEGLSRRISRLIDEAQESDRHQGQDAKRSFREDALVGRMDSIEFRVRSSEEMLPVLDYFNKHIAPHIENTTWQADPSFPFLPDDALLALFEKYDMDVFKPNPDLRYADKPFTIVSVSFIKVDLLNPDKPFKPRLPQKHFNAMRNMMTFCKPCITYVYHTFKHGRSYGDTVEIGQHTRTYEADEVPATE